MATTKLSLTDYVADGSTTQFPITFDRLQDSHVFVEDRNTKDPIPFSIVGNNAVTNTAPANGTVVRVGRKTPRDVRLAIYQDGSTLLATDLNTLSKQLLFVVQEAYDYADTNAEDAIASLLEDAEVAADEAENARDTAETYRDEAFQWTARAEDSQYTDSAGNTGYSSYHWAQKAAASADAAAAWDPSQYVQRVPSSDRPYALGRSDRRFNTIHAYYGNFYNNVVINCSDGSPKLQILSTDGTDANLFLDTVNESWRIHNDVSVGDRLRFVAQNGGGNIDFFPDGRMELENTLALKGGRLDFGNRGAPGGDLSDLSNHICLYGSPAANARYGWSVSSGGLGHVAGNFHEFYTTGGGSPVLIGRLANYGTGAPDAKALITRDMGDARYARKEDASLFGTSLYEWNVNPGEVYTNTSGHFQVVYVILYDRETAEMRTPGGNWYEVGSSGTSEIGPVTMIVPPGAEYRFPNGVPVNGKRRVLT